MKRIENQTRLNQIEPSWVKLHCVAAENRRFGGQKALEKKMSTKCIYSSSNVCKTKFKHSLIHTANVKEKPSYNLKRSVALPIKILN